MKCQSNFESKHKKPSPCRRGRETDRRSDVYKTAILKNKKYFLEHFRIEKQTENSANAL
jgi:hypothetical protein